MMLIIAAKKHQTEVRYWEKNIPVTIHDAAISIPNTHIRLTDETKKGAMVDIK
jgi:hypothetical protein